MLMQCYKDQVDATDLMTVADVFSGARADDRHQKYFESL